MNTNLNPNNAPEPRVSETPYTSLAHHKLAGMLLWLAGQYRHPRQQAMIVEYMFANGFDLRARVRAPYDLAELDLRLLALDDLVQDERDDEWAKLYDEIAEIIDLAKPGKGGGSHE
jgi:hypothetical protein